MSLAAHAGRKDEPVTLSERLTGSETAGASTQGVKPAAGRWGWLLGLIVPVGLALGWEFAVAFGFGNGRLLPPPSRAPESWRCWCMTTRPRRFASPAAPSST